MCSGSVHTFHTSPRGASKTRVPRISRSPTSAAFLLSAAMLGLLGDQVCEALERLAPALVLAAAGLARRRGLPHGHLRLAALVGERHGGHELVTTVTFADEGGKTKVTVRQTTPPGEAGRGQNQGWSETLERLADLIAEETKHGRGK